MVFDRFEKSDPDVQRGILRQMVEKITVFKDNKIVVRWRVPYESGGRPFDFDKEWGDQWGLNPRMPESQSGALTASP